MELMIAGCWLLDLPLQQLLFGCLSSCSWKKNLDLSKTRTVSFATVDSLRILQVFPGFSGPVSIQEVGNLHRFPKTEKPPALKKDGIWGVCSKARAFFNWFGSSAIFWSVPKKMGWENSYCFSSTSGGLDPKELLLAAVYAGDTGTAKHSKPWELIGWEHWRCGWFNQKIPENSIEKWQTWLPNTVSMCFVIYWIFLRLAQIFWMDTFGTLLTRGQATKRILNSNPTLQDKHGIFSRCFFSPLNRRWFLDHHLQLGWFHPRRRNIKSCRPFQRPYCGIARHWNVKRSQQRLFLVKF